MPEPGQAKGLIPKHLTILCAHTAMAGAAGAASTPSSSCEPLLLGLPWGCSRSCCGWGPLPAPMAQQAEQHAHTNRNVCAVAARAKASLLTACVRQVGECALSSSLCHGQPGVGLGLHAGWELCSACTTHVPPPATLPNAEQPGISEEPLHKHIGGSSCKAGASSAVENKSLNVWYMKFKLSAKAKINLC